GREREGMAKRSAGRSLVPAASLDEFIGDGAMALFGLRSGPARGRWEALSCASASSWFGPTQHAARSTQHAALATRHGYLEREVTFDRRRREWAALLRRRRGSRPARAAAPRLPRH